MVKTITLFLMFLYVVTVTLIMFRNTVLLGCNNLVRMTHIYNTMFITKLLFSTLFQNMQPLNRHCNNITLMCIHILIFTIMHMLKDCVDFWSSQNKLRKIIGIIFTHSTKYHLNQYILCLTYSTNKYVYLLFFAIQLLIFLYLLLRTIFIKESVLKCKHINCGLTQPIDHIILPLKQK